MAGARFGVVRSIANRSPASGRVAGPSAKGAGLPRKGWAQQVGTGELFVSHGQARPGPWGSQPCRFLPVPAKGPLQRVHEALVMRQDGALPLDVGDNPLLGRPTEAAD